jgi:type II secretory pathway component PulC
MQSAEALIMFKHYDNQLTISNDKYNKATTEMKRWKLIAISSLILLSAISLYIYLNHRHQAKTQPIPIPLELHQHPESQIHQFTDGN